MLFEMQTVSELKEILGELCDFLTKENITQERVFDSKLIAHELLGNVAQHSGGSAKLFVEIREGFIQLSLRAERVYEPPKSQRPSLYAERGRGLYLVDSLCERTFTPDGEILIRIKID